MSMALDEALDEDNAQWGLVHARILDGKGGARAVARTELDDVQLQPHECLWLHWDRGHPQTQNWLRQASGLNEFSCDLLLEENTRPRLLPLPDSELLLFLRGVNLNPGAEPEDMVSVRIFAAQQRVISLRLRSLRATEQLLEQLDQQRGPRSSSELLLYLAQYLTDKVEPLLGDLADVIDLEEEQSDADPHYSPDYGSMLQTRRRAAGLKRFLAPQRDIFSHMVRLKLGWFLHDDPDYWNELHNSLTRYLEELELIRERVGLLMESEDRRRSEQMNRTMYRFGVITGVFLPMTFLTGLLGMNVGGLPGSNDPYGFLIACGLMGTLGLGQWWLFRRLRWV